MARPSAVGYACTVADRLPRTFAALAAGQIHPVAVKIIEDETRYLSAKNVAKADAVLAELAGSKSFARLRYAAHRLVLKVDPDYAQRRKDEDRKYAHVRRGRQRRPRASGQRPGPGHRRHPTRPTAERRGAGHDHRAA
jgi:hypothetical protein